MATTISVPFTMMNAGGLNMSYSADAGGAVSVKFKVAWDDVFTFIQELTGTASFTLNSGGSGPSIQAEIPYQFPGSPNLYCRAIESVEPFGHPMLPTWVPLGSWLVRKEAIVTARFEYFPFSGNVQEGQADASGKPFTSTSIQLSAEIATIPNFTLKFKDGVPNNTPFPIVIPQATISMKRMILPYLPVLEMLTILGKVNSGPLQLGNFLADIGTVLFCGGATDVTLNTDGTVIQTCEYQFMYRAYPWNYAIHPKKGTWQIVTNSGGDTPYQYDPTNFAILP